MRKNEAERLAVEITDADTNEEGPPYSYEARHSAIEGGWYVAKIDCASGRELERIYE